MDTLPQPRSHADAPSVPHGSDGAAFGQLLRRARERRGLTLQQIAHETNIPERRLQALEHGSLSAMPGGVYQRAEVRAIARMIGLDQNVALAEFERVLRSPEDPALPATALIEDTRPRALAAIGAVTFTLAAIAILAMWTYTLTKQARARQVLDATFVAPEGPPEFPRAPMRISGNINAPTPASSEVEGQLVVTTQPAGARVTVNGVGWGVTPVTIRHLPFGEHRVRVTREGYESTNRTVSLAEDRPTGTVHLRLRVRK